MKRVSQGYLFLSMALQYLFGYAQSARFLSAKKANSQMKVCNKKSSAINPPQERSALRRQLFSFYEQPSHYQHDRN